jgi:hypothetical protein
MSQLQRYRERTPDVIDADFRVVETPTASGSRSLPIFRLLLVTPILVAMFGGALNLWSGNAAMLGAFAGTFGLAGLNAMFDPSRLRPLAVPLAVIAALSVLFLVGGGV